MTKAERHMDRVSKLLCITCGNYGVQVHHIRTERIKDPFLTIPLCLECHMGKFSTHKSKRAFENIYGSELHLLAKTLRVLEA